MSPLPRKNTQKITNEKRKQHQTKKEKKDNVQLKPSVA